MAYELKPTEVPEEEKEEKVDDFSDLEQTVYKMTNREVENAEYGSPIQNEKSSPVVKLAILAVLVLIGVGVGFGVYNAFLKGPKDITNYVKRSEADISSELRLQFQESAAAANSIHQYSNGKITVHANDAFSIIYLDGKQVGIKIDNKKYSMFNVKIGDPEYTASKNMTYVEDDSFTVLKDGASTSESDFHYNVGNNDCLVLVLNKQSNRVVSIQYFTDYEAVTANLGSLEE